MLREREREREGEGEGERERERDGRTGRQRDGLREPSIYSTIHVTF
jgi:hypothetical protein